MPRDRGDGDGWRYEPVSEELVLSGSACDTLLASAVAGVASELELELACEG